MGVVREDRAQISGYRHALTQNRCVAVEPCMPSMCSCVHTAAGADMWVGDNGTAVGRISRSTANLLIRNIVPRGQHVSDLQSHGDRNGSEQAGLRARGAVG